MIKTQRNEREKKTEKVKRTTRPNGLAGREAN